MMSISEVLAGVMSATTIEKKAVNAPRALNEAYDYERPSSFSRAMRLEFGNVVAANIIMAAVLAKGRTTIYNAACEPYIQQLCRLLVSMGAKIEGIGSNLLYIDGVTGLSGCTHTILPDMIEIGSFIGMAAITESEITIKNT